MADLPTSWSDVAHSLARVRDENLAQFLAIKDRVPDACKESFEKCVDAVCQQKSNPEKVDQFKSQVSDAQPTHILLITPGLMRYTVALAYYPHFCRQPPSPPPVLWQSLTSSILKAQPSGTYRPTFRSWDPTIRYIQIPHTAHAQSHATIRWSDVGTAAAWSTAIVGTAYVLAEVALQYGWVLAL